MFGPHENIIYQTYTLSSLFQRRSDNKVSSLPKETCHGQFFKVSSGSTCHQGCEFGPLAMIRQWCHQLFLGLWFCPHWFKSLLMLQQCFIRSTCSLHDYPGRPHICRLGLQAFQNYVVPLSSLRLSWEWLSLFIINRDLSHRATSLLDFCISSSDADCS